VPIIATAFTFAGRWNNVSWGAEKDIPFATQKKVSKKDIKNEGTHKERVKHKTREKKVLHHANS